MAHRSGESSPGAHGKVVIGTTARLLTVAGVTALGVRLPPFPLSLMASSIGIWCSHLIQTQPPVVIKRRQSVTESFRRAHFSMFDRGRGELTLKGPLPLDRHATYADEDLHLSCKQDRVGSTPTSGSSPDQAEDCTSPMHLPDGRTDLVVASKGVGWPTRT